jgi:hypothetical protein
MFDLDPQQMPAEMCTLFLARGRGLPPLQWHRQPNPLAAKTLGEIDDAKLFRRVGLANVGMSKAVRALLYLWSGLPEKAIEEAVNAPEIERAYIEGVCERQAGNTEPAKRLFQQVGVHPIFAQLNRHGLRVLSGARGATLVRLLQAVKQGDSWEPFLFVDAHLEALAAKLSDVGVSTVCTLQCIEFELLFRHCCETAIGEKLARRTAQSSSREQEARLAEMRKLVDRHRDRTKRPAKSDVEEPEPVENEDEALPQEEPHIMIACPKCKKTVDLLASARGQCARCSHCSVMFMVPTAPGGVGSPEAAPKVNLVGVRCPKCREMLMFPEEARGKPERCGKCGVTFLIPVKKDVAGVAGK